MDPKGIAGKMGEIVAVEGDGFIYLRRRRSGSRACKPPMARRSRPASG
jgi:hypothetical protein